MKRPSHDEDDDLDLPKGRKGRPADDDDNDDDLSLANDDLDEDDAPLPKDIFNDEDDLSDDDDEPKPLKRSKGKGASAEDKYADYLMYRDTGSSHDEALDLASMSDAEYKSQSAGSRDAFESDEEDDVTFAADDDDDEDGESFTRGANRRGGSFDEDDY